jgi:hypothetical protein
MDRTNLSLGVDPGLGAVTGPIPDEANGLGRLARFSNRLQARFMIAPSGMTPVSR